MYQRLVLGIGGSLIYAATGAFWGAKNAGWFGLERDARWLQAGLGVGAALVALAFARVGWKDRLRAAGGAGRAAIALILAGAVLNVVGSAIEFAIFGTLALGFGLVLLAIVAVRARWDRPIDRAFIAVSALGSLTWNTETSSVWFLVGVGLIWTGLSIHLLPRAAEWAGPQHA